MDSYLETPEGLLLVVDGFDPMLLWDGQSAQMVPAGVAPPPDPTTMSLSGSGVGGIVGTYNAYVRFVDNLGFFSNLSGISPDFTALSSGTNGNITDASFAAPIQITSAGHGLLTGAIVKVSGVGGNTAANGLWTITVTGANTFTLDGSSGNSTYTGSGTWNAGISTITYNGVPTTTDPKVVRRQILRNTDGEEITYYVDVDTTDLSSTTFSSTRTDAELIVQESQAILDSDGLPLANLHSVPPTTKTSLAAVLGRVFLGGQYDETRGAVVVTTGSNIVQGIGTDWVSGLAGRVLYVVGAVNNYTISSVDVLLQQITLTSSYTDASDEFGVYAIRPQPAERRLVYYTPPGQPESFPPTQALSIQEDDDEITGLMARGAFLYVLERRHIYKITFQDDPAKDGGVFLAANRGCINNRCWQLVDGDAYMLDEYGIHKFTSGVPEPLSDDIQEIFRPGSLYKFNINWTASRHFFAVTSRPYEIIRWFVALEGDYLPRHCIAYHYRLKRWWLERYPFAVGAGVSGHINNIPVTFLLGEGTKVYAMWQGTTDVANPELGTIRGTVTSSGIITLTDSTASFCTSGKGSVINSPVVIFDGTGRDQVRRVVSATATTLTMDMPWTESLDITSTYQVGGVVWNWRSTWMRLTAVDKNQERQIEILFEPTIKPAQMDFSLTYDFAKPELTQGRMSSSQGGGVRSDVNKPNRIIDLTKADSVVQIRTPGHRQRFTDGRRYVQIALGGASNEDLVAVFEMILEGLGNVATVSQSQQ
jgi:hypothetical protein